MAGRIPKDFIDGLLSRCDIVDIVGSRVPLRKVGSNYSAVCPFHSEKTPSFTVSPGKQFYHCFGCGAHGTAIGFVMAYDRVEFPEAVESLARQLGLEVPRSARPERPKSQQDMLRLLDRADQRFRQWLRQHPRRHEAVEYLHGRGIEGRIAADYGLGYAPAGWDSLLTALRDEPEQLLVDAGLLVRRDGGGCYDRFRNRIMFPIRDRRGQVIGFGGRVLDDAVPKYLNSPETEVFQKGREIYGLHECLGIERRPAGLLVVEGYLDVISLAQHGHRNAVATLGTATTRFQVERLFQVTSRLLYCFDGDTAGRQAAWRALVNTLPALRDGREAEFVFLPEGEDPDSLVRRDPAAFQQLLDSALPLAGYLLETLQADQAGDTMERRARLVQAAAPLLGAIPAGIFRDLLVDEVAQRARCDRRHVQTAMDATDAGAVPAPHEGGTERRPRVRRPSSTRRTPLRLAMALLLEQPALSAEALPPGRLRELPGAGAGLLAELVEITGGNPHLNTAGVLSRFAGREEESILWRLARWDHLTPEEGVRREFADAMASLDRQLRRQRLSQLRQKFESGTLTAEEQAEWLEAMRADSRTGQA